MIGSVLLSILSVAGWWLLSTPDPALAEWGAGSRARVVLRSALLVALGVTLYNAAHHVLTQGSAGVGVITSGVLEWLELIATAVRFFASILYLRWLAPRLPDDSVDNRARVYMWVLPLLWTVGALLCGLGPILALIMYYMLISDVRSDLLDVRVEQQREGDRG